jgi:hypothetical protein
MKLFLGYILPNTISQAGEPKLRPSRSFNAYVFHI